MLAHLTDHFVFSSKRWSERTKWTVFGVFVSALVLSFWWFKGVAFGIEGPIHEHWGLKWRKVRVFSIKVLCFERLTDLVDVSQTWNVYSE